MGLPPKYNRLFPRPIFPKKIFKYRTFITFWDTDTQTHRPLRKHNLIGGKK